MLTFFEYLRQRAFESIVAGTQDAIAYLGSQKHFDATTAEAKTKAPSLDPPVNSDSSGPLPTQDELLQSSESKKDVLPPPRRRGRPRKDAKQKR